MVPGSVSQGQGIDWTSAGFVAGSGEHLSSIPRVLIWVPQLPRATEWAGQRLLTFTMREWLCPLPLVQTILYRIPDHLEARVTEQTDFGTWLSISGCRSQVRHGSF